MVNMLCLVDHLHKQDGTLLLEKGKHLSNTQLMSMNYFVKGVDAAYPK